MYTYKEGDITSDDLEVDHVWVTIPSAAESEGNAVFASTVFHFESEGVGGYLGTQVWRPTVFDSGKMETHQAIFSAWDKDDTHKVGWVGDNCGRFGGEGTGSHCMLDFKFKQGQRYTVRIKLTRGA